MEYAVGQEGIEWAEMKMGRWRSLYEANRDEPQCDIPFWAIWLDPEGDM